MSGTGDSDKMVVACGECRRRKWVMPYRVGSAQCCGRPMTREAATATVTIRCTACQARDQRLWSLGPGYTCNRCGRSAVVTAAKPPRLRSPERSHPPTTSRTSVEREKVAASLPRRPVETSASVIAEVASFLNDAGVRASASETGLEHDGGSIDVPRFRRDPSAARSTNAVVAEHFMSQLVRAVREHLELPRPGVDVRHRAPSPNVEVVMAGSVVAYVSATEWKRPKRTDAGNGNFLLPGDHWSRLRALTGLAAETPERPRTPPPGLEQILPEPDAPRAVRAPMRDGPFFIHYDFPAELANELVELATEASRRIRTERSLAFGHVVQLRSTSGFELRFSPVSTSQRRPEMSVRFSEGRAVVDLHLRVSALGDPLPVRVAADAAPTLLARAWALALIAFAELTCPDDPTHLRRPAPTARSRPPARHPGRSGVASRTTDPERRIRRPATPTPRTFEPIGETSRYISSYVAGHRRRLAPGQSASSEAISNATAAGIVLRSDETWVVPHTRGVPPGITLHFAWTPPRVARTV